MRTDGLERVRTGHLDHDVWLRRGTSDPVVWGEVFTGRYHVPPASMPVPPATVLDLGSNIGLTLADYRHRWPEALVVGVEMDAENVELAMRNAPGARVIHAAVAGEAGPRTYARGASFALRLGEGEEVEVEARTLDEIILTEFGDPVDFVKMDVEWTEWELFAEIDHWRPLVRHLLVELHGHDPPGERVALAIDALWAGGFRAEAHEAHPASVWAVR